MPSPEVNIVQNVCKAIQYTGSNSADIDLQVPGCNIVSESGGILNLEVNGREFSVPTNGWVFWSSFLTDSLSNTQYNNEWGRVALGSELDAVVLDLDAVSDTVSSLQADGAVRAVGVAPVPTLAASANTVVSVTLDPPLSSVDYSPSALLFAGVDISDLVVNSVTVVDEGTVDVEVENSGPGSLSGANVLVIASV